MLDISNILFLDSCDDIETARKDYGFEGIESSDHFLIPLSKRNYLIVYNPNNPGGFNINNYVQSFCGNTRMWLMYSFKDIRKVSSYYEFSDVDFKRIKDSVGVNMSLTNKISISFEAESYKDIESIHDTVCEILNLVPKRSIMFEEGYDRLKDGCMCRVCGYWSPMAPSDGLSDGKFNCWNCKTYRQYACMTAVESLTK